jgi:hypothetical protein
MLSQCSIPVFSGIFPLKEHDKKIQKLLFIMCEWHALAKLRIHTDSTLVRLEEVTTALGSAYRDFATKICPSYHTIERQSEYDRRTRRDLHKTGRATEVATHQQARRPGYCEVFSSTSTSFSSKIFFMAFSNSQRQAIHPEDV